MVTDLTNVGAFGQKKGNGKNSGSISTSGRSGGSASNNRNATCS